MRLYIISFLAMLLCGCSGAEYRNASGAVWGTTYNITYKAESDLSDSITAVMQQVDMSLSPFQPQSIVSKVNRNEDVAADSMLAQVFDLSQQVCRLSQGAFDPTVAPVINLWGFGYRQGEEMPIDEQIDSVLATVGIMDCSIDAEGRICKKSPQTEFNFSAIAKGYGVDAIAAMLGRNGCQDYMVEVGGEIALRGNNPKGEPWRIQIDAPVLDSTGFNHQRLTVLQITDQCVATSGNYRNFRMVDGQVMGHTISPVTGRPVQTTTLSVTILAPTTALADALATSAMALPLEDATEMLIAQPDVRALIVTCAPDSTFSIIQIPDGWHPGS